MERWMPMAAAAAALLLSSPAAAQEGEAPSCEEACYEAEEGCFRGCEDADDPAVCEDACEGETERCLGGCEGDEAAEEGW